MLDGSRSVAGPEISSAGFTPELFPPMGKPDKFRGAGFESVQSQQA